MAKRKHGGDKEPLKEAIPAEIKSQLGGVLADDEEIKLAISADIRLDGRYGDAWVLATEDQLIGVSPNGGAPDIVQLPLAEVDGVEVRELVGMAELKARTAERGAVIAQFSKTLIPKFSPVARQLEDLVRQARPAEQEESIVRGPGLGRGRGKRCQRCGNVIPRRAGVCPACLETRKVLFRLLGYAKPHWKLVALSLAMMVVATTIGLSPPILMRTLIDDVFSKGGGPAAEILPGAVAAGAGAGTWMGGMLTGWGMERADMLVFMVVLLFAIYVSRNSLAALRGYLLSYLGQKITFGMHVLTWGRFLFTRRI